METPLALRSGLLKMLEEYADRWPLEGPMIRRFQQFVQESPILQGKENLQGHVTASCWIVNAERTKALLTHHKKLGFWVQLGGHTEPGEDWLTSALREAQEESGLQSLTLLQESLFDVDIHAIPPHGETPGHFHYDLRFLLEAQEAEPLVLTEESNDLAWIEIKKLGDMTSEESQHRMAGKVTI